MFKLFRMDTGRFRLISKTVGLDTEGSREEIIEQMERLGTDAYEIDLAFSDMTERGNNLADFGVNIRTGAPGFIYSCRAKLEYVNLRESRFVYENEHSTAA